MRPLGGFFSRTTDASTLQPNVLDLKVVLDRLPLTSATNDRCSRGCSVNPRSRAHSGEIVISYPRTKIFFGQDMKIHVYLGPVTQGMCWFFCCFTPEKKFQSWGVGAKRSREGLRLAHLLGSCASGMAGSKILTYMPKTTGHAPSGHKTE